MRKPIRRAMPYSVTVEMPAGEEPWTVYVFGREYTQLMSFSNSTRALRRPYSRRRPTPSMIASWVGGRLDETRDATNMLVALDFWCYDDGCIPSIGEGYDHHGIAYLKRLTLFSKWMANSHFEEDRPMKQRYENPYP